MREPAKLDPPPAVRVAPVPALDRAARSTPVCMPDPPETGGPRPASKKVPPLGILAAADGRDRVTLRVRGRLDRVGISRLRTELAGWRAVGVPILCVDVSAVSRWDPGLPRALAWARSQLRAHGQELIITGGARLSAAVAAEETTFDLAGWRGARPGEPGYRPETADQP